MVQSGLRATSQSISYEISLPLCIINSSTRLDLICH
jgi:hypothetical protein